MNSRFSDLANDIDARVRAEQIRVIFQQAPPALAISLVVSAVLCFILWTRTDRVLLIGWFALLVALAFARLWTAIRRLTRILFSS